MRVATSVRLAALVLGACVFWMAAPSASAEKLEIPMKKLVGESKIHLRCISGMIDIPIPIPDRWKVESAQIKFGYINSTNLLEDSSQLVIKFNDDPVAQAKLSPNDPEGKLNVNIPVGLFEEGYNTLTFLAN
ncbi:MAG: cellulose biosynthesis cyclic di-GMP-binding regulatory protein BcsB, partial [Nitrospinae bacterium]|nr:cellulose biosynthesis cyclic di-GMP-binding regulatory protein BcsB [Nitrospinota bacterium]